MREPGFALPAAMLPEGLRDRAFTLRRFGELDEDLEVDFLAPRPAVVSRLIGCCADDAEGNAMTPAEADELSVSTRVVCLLLLIALEGHQELDAVLSCPDCRQPIELVLAIEEVLAFAPAEPHKPIIVEVGDRPVNLRRPTGADQRAWLHAGFLSEADARQGVARSLLLAGHTGSLLDEWVATLEASLEEHDPLVCFSLEAACPFCDSSSTQELPLIELALDILRRAQDRLVQSVHRLAVRYGWSEAEVFAVPAWRRARYLSFIEAGIG